MSPDPTDELITPQACEILKVNRSSLTRWVKQGRLKPSRKLPGRTGAYLFRRADVEALAKQLADAGPQLELESA